VPGSVGVVIVLLLLIFRPWEIEVRPTQEAVAAENRLAIMYFDNLADPEDKDRIARMITSLLITDLSESRYMQVVSRQRLHDILKLLGKEDLKVIDKFVASEVAEKAGVNWILTGDILQTEPNIVLTSDMSQAATGEILATQRVTGGTGEDLFSVVDRLTVEIKKDLSLPAAAYEEPFRFIAEVTTHSPEAYRCYLEGVDYTFKYYFPEAEKSFRKSLEFDSTFAMAYYWLSTLVGASEQKEVMAKAVKYSDKVNWKEKQYIKAQAAYLLNNYEHEIAELQKIVERYPQEKDAFYKLGFVFDHRYQRYEEAVHYYNKAIQIDPIYKEPYNQIAYIYSLIGDFEKAMWAINKYIEIAPDEANPYDSRGELYAWNGKLDQAIESYKRALEIKPDFDISWFKLGHVYLFKREYAKAESCYRQPSSSSEKETRSNARLHLAFIPLYQGKFDQALEVLDDGIAADRLEQAEGWANISKYFQKAHIHKERKDLQSALKEIEKGMEAWHKIEPDHVGYGREYYVQFLAENREFEKAEEVALALKNDIVEKDSTVMYWYWYAAGCIEMEKGNLEASVNSFEKVPKHFRIRWANYMLAQAYLETGRLGEAIAELENQLYNYYLLAPICIVKSYYYLGLAYERSGWNREAIEKYEEFLEIWKDADPGIAEIEDARERLTRLKKES
jgi:tetratricopeptide (TPR) repeat protein